MPDSRTTVLVVDADGASRDTLVAALRRDYRVLQVGSGEAALQAMEKEHVDLVVVDVQLPGIGGFDVLRIVRENHPYIEVVVLSARRDIEIALEAMRLGAYHYASKDVDLESVPTLVAGANEHQALSRKVLQLSSEVAERNEREFIVGSSRSAREVVEQAHKLAKLPITVLILGESGTGKELLARMIHRESDRPKAPFVAVNLAAIPKELVESTLFGHEKGAFTGAIRQQLGKFELATGGTLFLDEVGDLHVDLQGKLLRALQEGEIERVGGAHPIETDFRLIAATNVDLERAVREGRFRGDLFYRLNVFPIKMPPLRARLEDLPALADFFRRRCNQKFRKHVEGIAESTLEIMATYEWPGNIRELENMVERLIAITDKSWITDEDLPYDLHVAKLNAATGGENRLEQALTAFERHYIVRALEKDSWVVSATAKSLGLPLSTLKFRMKRLDIKPARRQGRRS